ncbi:hypothetical protein D8674_032962 [Pyrus ussuriensis x Pyrus communis]|uniref:RNase H type-1 domain-containing protein n=1 Tax=Pyrus ussuriensis x Pyrus communis TaxID=2448454 RepID=A0A5N5HMW3_9ROSA|nr:hypothetical protein D8674_032962 [Pyrus ussuriensis x Pyrus communis]
MQGSCILHFDGTLNGNPGIAGARAVLRADDGRLVYILRLGVVTNNVAEYQAVILGLNCAHKKGFTRISVQGDSKLVCMQAEKDNWTGSGFMEGEKPEHVGFV